MSDDPAWVRFGVLTRPHGVRGEIRLSPDSPGVPFPDIEDVRLERREEIREAKLESVRTANDAYLVSFVGLTDRDEVRERLAGWAVLVPLDSVEDPGEHEAYVFELQGAVVIDEAGHALGVVGAVLAAAGQDLLRIDGEAGERLLPMVPQTIRNFDRDKRVLTVAPIPGLWDDEA